MKKLIKEERKKVAVQLEHTQQNEQKKGIKITLRRLTIDDLYIEHFDEMFQRFMFCFRIVLIFLTGCILTGFVLILTNLL
jgi:hypothetical protein